jgi:hypothetical protein
MRRRLRSGCDPKQSSTYCKASFSAWTVPLEMMKGIWPKFHRQYSTSKHGTHAVSDDLMWTLACSIQMQSISSWL